MAPKMEPQLLLGGSLAESFVSFEVFVGDSVFMDFWSATIFQKKRKLRQVGGGECTKDPAGEGVLGGIEGVSTK